MIGRGARFNIRNVICRYLQRSRICAILMLTIFGCTAVEAANFSECVRATTDYIRDASRQGVLFLNRQANPAIEANQACRLAKNNIYSATSIVETKLSQARPLDKEIEASSIALKKNIYNTIATAKVHKFDRITNLALLFANQAIFHEESIDNTEESFVFARIPAGLVSVNGQETQVGLYVFDQSPGWLARARRILEMLERWEEQGDWQDITDQLVSTIQPNTTRQPVQAWDEIGMLIDMSELATDQVAGEAAGGALEGVLGTVAGNLIAGLIGVSTGGAGLAIAAGTGAASAGLAAYLDGKYDETKDKDKDGTPDYRDDYPDDPDKSICSWCPRGFRLIDTTRFQDNIFYLVDRFTPEDMIGNQRDLQSHPIRNLIFQP